MDNERNDEIKSTIGQCTQATPEFFPATVGELRQFLEPFGDDVLLQGIRVVGAFRYVLDGDGSGLIQYG